MALNINNKEVERLLEQLVRLTGESKTAAARRAVEERRQRLAPRFGERRSAEHRRALLQDERWPLAPAAPRAPRRTKKEEEAILGYGGHGQKPHA